MSQDTQDMADASNGVDINPAAGGSSAPPSTLSTIVGGSPQMPSPQSPGSPEEQQMDADTSGPQGGMSRLQSVLSAVAKVGSTALSGVPAGNRPSFAGGLGQGARAEQAAQATQQNIKFKDFDNQVRMAQLHNEDLRMQWADEDHQDAVQANADAQADRLKQTTGMTYTFVPNSDGGKEVLDHMGVQMAQSGSVSVPAGTIAGPKGWYIPNKGSAEQAAANTKDFNARAPFFGFLPTSNGQVVNDRAYDQLRQASNGLDNQGHPMSANDLQGRVDNMKEQLSKYKEQANADPNTITAVQSDINHLTNLSKITDAREQSALDDAAQRKTDATNQVNDNKAVNQIDVNAKKPQKAEKPQNVDGNGNPVWVPGVSADEKKKAELSENVVFNANNIASILQRRPDIVGRVAGRFTTLDQMTGTNDPDITSLQQDMHNIAIANVGIHGMRANDAVHDVEGNILNNFKNGPLAIGGALKSTANSVQTFIDNARPNTYKTHSKNGGAMRSMIPQQGQ